MPWPSFRNLNSVNCLSSLLLSEPESVGEPEAVVEQRVQLAHEDGQVGVVGQNGVGRAEDGDHEVLLCRPGVVEVAQLAQLEDVEGE